LASALPVKRSPNLTTFTQQIAPLVLNRQVRCVCRFRHRGTSDSEYQAASRVWGQADHAPEFPTLEQRLSCSRGSGRQRFALVNIRARLRARQTELKQLANYSERKSPSQAPTREHAGSPSRVLQHAGRPPRAATVCQSLPRRGDLAGPNRESGDSQQRDVRFQHSEILTMHRLDLDRQNTAQCADLRQRWWAFSEKLGRTRRSSANNPLLAGDAPPMALG